MYHIQTLYIELRFWLFASYEKYNDNVRVSMYASRRLVLKIGFFGYI